MMDRLAIGLITVVTLVVLAISGWLYVTNLITQRDDLLSKNLDLNDRVIALGKTIQTITADHDRQIAAISALDRRKSAVSALIEPLLTQSDMLVFFKDTPDAPTDRFVRDANSLNGNLIRMLEQNSN